MMIKKSITVANIVKQEWLARYPRPYLITLDRGSEFIGQDFRDMCVNDYGIKRKIISTQNPQANAIVERVHQMLGNLIRSLNSNGTMFNVSSGTKRNRAIFWIGLGLFF